MLQSKSEGQVQMDLQNFHKCKFYIILLGFKGCGKSTFLQSLTSNYFENTQDYKIIRYHDLNNIVQYNQTINDQTFQIIKVKSRFHEQIQIDYRRKIRFIDTPGISKLEDIEVVMRTISKLKKIKGNNFDQFFIYWMCDYSTMSANLNSQNILIEQLANQKTVILINKIDKREKEDDSVMEICQQFKFKAIYKISSLQALEYNIMNYGNEQDKQLCQQLNYKKSLIQIKQSLTESQHKKKFLSNIESIKKKIDQTDYNQMINTIQEQLIKGYKKNELIFKLKQFSNEPIYELSISQLKGQQICQLLDIQATFFNQSINQLKIDAYYNIKDQQFQDIKKISNFFSSISAQIELIIEKIKQLVHSLYLDVSKSLKTYIPQSEVDDDIEFIGISNYEQNLEKQFNILIENILLSFDKIENTLEQKIANTLHLFEQKNKHLVTKSIVASSLFGCSVVCSPVIVSASICILIVSVSKLLSEKKENYSQQVQDNFDV